MRMLPPGAATVAAVGSHSKDKARRFLAEIGFPAARVHGSYESLLGNPDVEAMYLPLPTSLHVPSGTDPKGGRACRGYSPVIMNFLLDHDYLASNHY